MKTLKGVSQFGFSIVNAGKRVQTVNPELVLTSSQGTMRITAPVSKALGLTNGDYIMFINTHDNLDIAIAQRNPDLVAICEEQGFDIASKEAYDFIHAEFGHILMAKGIAKVDSMGNPVMTRERITTKQKVNYVLEHYDECYEAVINGENEEAIAQISRDGVSKEEIVEVLCNFVKGNEIVDYQGSKVAQASDLEGSDVSLNFNDSAMWKTLKAGLTDEEMVSCTRTYVVDTDLVDLPYTRPDGKEIIIKAVELMEYKDSFKK